jgi:nitroimidazol reductase NimA-like FMN-containing flavoprotein (pyridoxamine 5'-phosphate oxidase superfamily)
MEGMCDDGFTELHSVAVCSHAHKRSESGMAEPLPVTELSAFSSPHATPTDWSQARVELANAEVYWLSTVRPDGRPHVTPLLGIWLEGALYFCTGANERKAKNLSANSHCVLTTGQSTLDGLDLVIEATAGAVSNDSELRRVADTYESKYGPHIVAPDGTWSGLGDAIRQAEVLVYRVVPETGFGFGKGGTFSQTRWSF